ncbi:lasso peptide biosynthesis PqqD family chaperone [Sediminibacillus massiliensis]|uniref:lasso peptide biosynthesis PqqD family chaperone n=1 Tax=Sediminibacillus massiliensis TaxID=1926277 RepID=UPI000988783E|nr:lasso peptide biosynthesis PqqD family chaperone [Sediminibacillus massiliensis]
MINQQVIELDNVVVQTEGNIVSDMGGEKVMLSISNGKYYNLGEIGGEIWERIKEPVSVHSLVDSLIDQYEVEKNECRNHVTAFLCSLAGEGLVQVKS